MSQIGSDIREAVLRLLGDFPQKCDLEPREEGRERAEGYTRIWVSYKVEQEERVPAYLLVPEKKDYRSPAILAIHQHGGQFYLGKSEPAGLTSNRMYHYGADLCQRGYVVICPDQLGFEDRRPKEYERVEKHSLRDEYYERFLGGKCLLEGSTLQAKYLFDLSRAIDYLETLEYVDKTRIGALGHSLGGQETTWLIWHENRIKAGVSSCGIGLCRAWIRNKVVSSMAAYVPGLLKVCDMDDIVADIAPKPFLMINGEQDGLFPIDGVRKIGQKAKKSYENRGAGERFQLVTFPGGHCFPDEMKEVAYRWLDRWLRD